ncbi:MAG: hypothetical protein U5L72_14050 [Bacteroidales bacterium]|nr:hypothetical protein [Bacteroidales bacterium]
MILSTDTTHLILLALLIVTALIQGWYWLWYYRRACMRGGRSENNRPRARLSSLSTVISLRPELRPETSAKFLPAVDARQDYPPMRWWSVR